MFVSDLNYLWGIVVLHIHLIIFTLRQIGANLKPINLKYNENLFTLTVSCLS